MKNKERKYHGLTAVFVGLYIVYAVCLFLLHPFVASAAETDSAEKKIPGGKGNVVSFESTRRNDKNVNSSAATFTAKEDFEIVAVIVEMGVGLYEKDKPTTYMLDFKQINGKGQLSNLSKGGLDDCTGFRAVYKDGSLQNSSAYTLDSFPFSCDYRNCTEPDTTITCTISGCKIFKDSDALVAYVENGNLDGMIKDAELDKTWYLKDIRCKVTADDSPSGSGGEDATYIKFYWLTDNLEAGDLIEVKSHNYVKKIGGDKISGFHDYITKDNAVSALANTFNDSSGNKRASWTVGQKEAVKAWFSDLENKPLIFKTYETDVYYFRPYRNGKVGGWCKVTMNRFGDSGSPYIEDVEIGDLDDDGNWTPDEDATDENGGNHGVDQGGNITFPDPDNPFEGTNIAGIFKYMFDFFKSIPSLLGELPALVNSVIGFLPFPIIGFIALGITVAIILRIVGR